MQKYEQESDISRPVFYKRSCGNSAEGKIKEKSRGAKRAAKKLWDRPVQTESPWEVAVGTEDKMWTSLRAFCEGRDGGAVA